MHAIIVEDQPLEREFFHMALRQNGLDVTSFAESFTALEYMRHSRADFMLIDFNLTGGPNGLTLARYLRRLYPSDVIVVMSAYADVDKLVDAIQIGVDDFLLKPIVASELVKRLDEALLRRRELFPVNPTTQILDAELAIDLSARTAFWYGKQLRLTPSQFALLAQLASRPGHVFGYSELYALSQGERLPPSQARSRLKSHIVNLRSKLERDGRPQAIHNVRGMGFKWEIVESPFEAGTTPSHSS